MGFTLFLFILFYEDSILCGWSEKLYTDIVDADKKCVDGGHNKDAKLAIWKVWKHFNLTLKGYHYRHNMYKTELKYWNKVVTCLHWCFWQNTRTPLHSTWKHPYLWAVICSNNVYLWKWWELNFGIVEIVHEVKYTLSLTMLIGIYLQHDCETCAMVEVSLYGPIKEWNIVIMWPKLPIMLIHNMEEEIEIFFLLEQTYQHWYRVI